jgi:DNA-binding SARP family transcriptional activator
VLRFQTFGSAFLTGPSGEPIAGAAPQRRTLALLAALAVAGESGASRDKLIGLLWPEVDAERARHSLTQALYTARKSVQVDDLFVVGADIRLNDARITSDVREFESALAAGDLQRAAELYRGPFLDGFFVSGSPEFERWSSAQRERLANRARDALDRLATAAESSGDYRSAIEWRKRLSMLFPFDSGVAVKLMTAMAKAGDRAGALQHAQAHATLLRDELDLEPDAVVEALAAKLRAPVQWTPDETIPEVAAHMTMEAGAVGSVRVSLASPDASSAPVRVWIPTSRARRWGRVAATISLAAVLIVVGTVAGRLGRPKRVALDKLAPRQRVVVAPFRVAGAAPGLEYLRDGMVELLSTRLADDTAARSVDAGAVLTAWQVSGLSSAVASPRDTVVALAARLGAERLVMGNVVGTPARLVINATVSHVPSGATVGEATVSGPVDSLTTLIDRLAGRLLVADAGEEERLATSTTGSLPALRAFLAGQSSFRRNDFASALQWYDVALRRDSTFALAALYRALAADELNDEAQLRAAVSLGWAGRAALSDRDRSMLLAFAGPRYPAPSTSAELAAAWQRVVDLAPGSAEAWALLGARLLHDGGAAGVSVHLARATNAYQRAISSNPDYVPAWRALIQLGASPPETIGPPAESLDSSPAQREAAARITPFIRWREAARTDDTAKVQVFRESLPRFGPMALRAIARASQFDSTATDDGVRALAALRKRATRPSELADLALAEHSLAMNRGRPSEALAAAIRLQRVLPGSHASLRLRLLDRLYAEGDSAAADAAARDLASVTGPAAASSATSSAIWLADACVLAQWRLAHGDTAGARTAVTALMSARDVTGPPLLVSTAPNVCALLLDASLAVAASAADARARVARLDSLVLTPQVAGDAIAYGPLLIARLHERLGNTSAALGAVRRRVYLSGWPRYLATLVREEGRLAAASGDSATARAAYTRYLSMRADAEEALSEDLEEARRFVGDR